MKATLSIEMNSLFEFYPEVRVDGVLVYTGSAYEQHDLAAQDGMFWIERNGHELSTNNDTNWHNFAVWDGEPGIGQLCDVLVCRVVYDGRGIFRLPNGHTISGVVQYRKVLE